MRLFRGVNYDWFIPVVTKDVNVAPERVPTCGSVASRRIPPQLFANVFSDCSHGSAFVTRGSGERFSPAHPGKYR